MQQGMHLALIDVHAVGGQDFRAENVLLFDVRDDRHSGLLAGGLNFRRGLGQVRVQWDVELNGQGCGSSQDFVRTGIDGMRRDGGDDQGVVLPALDELPGCRQGFLV
jgi:hypothetical protein